ncbi:tRNA (guanosine(37)-N1)-methyltransferase TrmD [Propionibacterium sp.]|uniref:tRNA (guanosine(37)-N1)-methyltransferase TrmD n=1 Tax=Propionibacterium sp. TaxID=1977903 RepID=UPI0039EAF073
MRIDTISIFPQYFDVLGLSLIGKALASGLIEFHSRDLRAFTHDRHRTVDDTPYGGGAGMVMKPEPWGEALDVLLASYSESTQASSCPGSGQGPNGLPPEPAPGNADSLETATVHGIGSRAGRATPEQVPVLIFTTPSGLPFSQQVASELATRPAIAFACGRYEGIDRRVIDWAHQHFEVRELSLGDYVLNGGEVAALAMIEAIVRLVPGVIGNPESLVEESYSPATEGMLEYPVYTKPASWRGLDVPRVLLSGDHGAVDRWRAERSLATTRARRPDLLGSQIPTG